MSKWAAFSQALEAANSWGLVCKSEKEVVQGAILQGQRFYFPGDDDLVADDNGFVRFRDTFKHPFVRYSIFSETGGDSGHCLQMMLCVQEVGVSSAESFCFRLAALVNKAGRWVPIPVVECRIIAGVLKCYGEDSDYRAIFDSAHEDILRHEALWTIAVARVLSLLALLGVQNVERQNVEAPQRLNRKRQRNGRLPLYSYHVLKVAGETWDSPYVSGSGAGYRSHLRRGHIRRLATGTVWVRATYVRGSVPGFVDKDYDLSRKAALA